MYPDSEDPFAVKINLDDHQSFVIPCFIRKLAKGLVSKYECSPGGLYAGPLGLEGKMNLTQIQSLKVALNSVFNDFSFRLNPFVTSVELDVPGSSLFTQVVDLTDRETISVDLQHSGVAYDARLAHRKGVRIYLEANVDLTNFLLVYDAIRRSWKSPGSYYPAEFIKLLTSSIHCDFWSVLHKNDYIGGGIILKGPKHVSSWLTIMHPELRNVRPYEYVYHHFIHHYSKAGFRYFDLNPSAGLDGVVKFKEKFGTKRIPFLQFEHQGLVSSMIAAIRGEKS